MTTYRVRVTRKRESGNLIEWEGVDVDAAAFVPTGTAAPVNPSNQVVRLPGITQVIAADLPPLREQDFGSTGYYGAGAPLTAAGWPGAAIWRKPDGGTEYAPEITLEVAATVGGTLNAIDKHGYAVAGGDQAFSGFYTDSTGYLDVALTNGTLSSCTHQEFMNFEQVALVGNELVAFRDAELIDTNVYRLRTFLRGLQGTEWFPRIGPQSVPYNLLIHADGAITEFVPQLVEGSVVGDQFLLLQLNAGIRRFVPGGGSTPISGVVRGITRGANVDSASDQRIEQTWASIVPPHPTHVRARKTGSDTFWVDFTPRSFIGTGRELGIDPEVPADQQYLVNFTYGQLYMVGSPPFTITYPGLDDTVADQLATSIQVSVAAIPRQFFNSNTGPWLGSGATWRVNGNPRQLRYTSSLRHFSHAVRVPWL